MKNKIIFIILTLIIFWWLLFLIFQKKDENKEIVSLENTQSIDKNISSAPVWTTNELPEQFKKIEEEASLLQQALNEKDISICKKIETEMQKNMCISSVVFELQKTSKNDEICNEIWDEMQKNMCKNEINMRVWNCNGIVDEMQKNMCNNQKTLQKAISSKDVSVCDTMNDPMQKNMCASQIIQAKIETSNNIKDCELFNNDMEKRQCMYTITVSKSIKENNLNLCNNLQNIEQSQCKTEVFLKIALQKNDINYCDKEKDFSFICRQNFAKEKISENLDIKYCDYIWNKSDCIFKTLTKKALIKQDIKICDEIFLGSQKDQCKKFYNDTYKQLQF